MAHIKKYDVLAPKAEELMRTQSEKKTAELLGLSTTRLRSVREKAKRDAGMPEWTRGLDIRYLSFISPYGKTVSKGLISNQILNWWGQILQPAPN